MKDISLETMTYSQAASEDGAMVWMPLGNCRDYPPAAFFPSDGVGVDRAKKICATCPVAEFCLEYALTTGQEHGVWGGTSERERRRINKRRRSFGGPAVNNYIADADIGEF